LFENVTAVTFAVIAPGSKRTGDLAVTSARENVGVAENEDVAAVEIENIPAITGIAGGAPPSLIFFPVPVSNTARCPSVALPGPTTSPLPTPAAQGFHVEAPESQQIVFVFAGAVAATFRP
jgi:hypothetical protein